MTRVLQVLGGLNRGGAETMVMNLYRKIDREKIQFDFIVHSKEPQAYTDEIISLGGKIYSFPKFNGKNLFDIKKYWNDFFKNHPEYKILHSHVRSYASIYLPIAKKYGVKTIIHSHSTSNGKGISSIVKKIMQLPLRKQADYLFACSQEAGEWLYGKKAIKKPNYKMIPNAIDTEKYIFNPTIRKTIRSQLGLSNEIVYIHVGRFHEAKNHTFLLSLFAEIHKENKNTKLLLLGDGELKQSILSQIENLSLKDSVILTGSVANVNEYLMASDIFLFPSKWEGLPVTVVEAQASGLPCLVSNKVTKDVNLSPLVHYLPIDNGINPWIDAINTIKVERQDCIEKIKTQGFDISKSANWLTNFYGEIIK